MHQCFLLFCEFGLLTKLLTAHIALLSDANCCGFSGVRWAANTQEKQIECVYAIHNGFMDVFLNLKFLSLIQNTCFIISNKCPEIQCSQIFYIVIFIGMKELM